MLVAPQPEYLTAFWENSFDLKTHLQAFLQLDPVTLETQLTERRHAVEAIGKHFDWAMVTDFYQDQVGTGYIFELAAWHLESADYIGDMLRLIADRAQGCVLDFGGGIGTHAIAAAHCPQVEQVYYVDLNPINCDFVRYRAEQLGITHKLNVSNTLPSTPQFDTIQCFDVVEHLPNPAQQLQEFHGWLKPNGTLLINWYFSKGFGNEFPFHLDDPSLVEEFFQVLQAQFIEQFHPHLITTRSYKKRVA